MHNTFVAGAFSARQQPWNGSQRSSPVAALTSLAAISPSSATVAVARIRLLIGLSSKTGHQTRSKLKAAQIDLVECSIALVQRGRTPGVPAFGRETHPGMRPPFGTAKNVQLLGAAR